MDAEWAIGLMTGTVLDGMIDIALIRTDGRSILAFGDWELAPYQDDVCKLIAEATAAALDWQFDGPEPASFLAAEEALTRAQSNAVATFLQKHGLKASEIGTVGFHGQTVLHRAPFGGRPGMTRQLGDGAMMASILGIDVAYDFRSDDMRAGGQGAPLSAIYHVGLLEHAGAPMGLAVLNLGGVANVTWYDGVSDFIAFDTGPANGPINDWVMQHYLGAMDVDGALAAQGVVDEVRLASLLSHPYLSQPYPKSLDRYDFTAAMVTGMSRKDGAATLTAFTAASVGRALDLLPVRPTRLAVCGGGRKNPTLMKDLERRAAVKVVLAEELGWRGDAVEAECFAFLAARVKRNLPTSFPTTTGVRTPMSGGRLARYARPA